MTHLRTYSRRRTLALAGTLGAMALVGADAAYGQRGSRSPRRMPSNWSTYQTPVDGSEFVVDQISRAGSFPVTQFIGPMTPQGLGYANQSGVRLSFEFYWLPSYGYVPITFRASSAQAAKRNRTLHVRLHANIWGGGDSIRVDQTFAWPKDAANVEGSLLVPYYTDGQGMSWEVFIDGRLDPQLSVANAQSPNRGTTGNVMVLTTAENAQQRSGYDQALRIALGDANMAFNAIAAAELPAEWIGYTSVDVMILPVEQVAELVQNHPRQAAALLRWVRAGGNLWIENVGRDWARLAELEKLLGLPEAENVDQAEGQATSEPRLDRGWHWPTVGDQQTPLADSVVDLLRTEEPAEPQDSTPSPNRQQPPAVTPPPSKALAVRRYGMGMVAAFERSLADESPGIRAAMLQRELSHSLVGPRLSWTSRHGNSPDNSNYDFNNLLIPGVGLAPVGQFQFLITLFVIGIGPLNYWLLKRKNKLPLLLVTVPLAAAAATSLLFAYGVLADGFNTRVRVRSITLLDQQTQEAATWARLSYYAGIAPRDGLVMPSDAALYPIMPRWDRRLHSRGGGVPRDLRWQADQQDLTRGWLASRTPTQYLQIAARPSSKRLDMRATDAGLTVANRLGVDVTHLAVQDHQGRIYWGENLAAGQRKVFQSADRNLAAGNIRRLFTENLPQFPGDYDAQSPGTPGTPGMPGMLYAQSMYEHGLSQNIMEAELAAINSALVDSWGDGSYIAVTKTGVEVALGVDGAAEEASFHVIRGTW